YHAKKISVPVDHNTSWDAQHSASRRSPDPTNTNSSIPRRSGDRPPRGHLPNSIVNEVHDEEISGTVDRHTTSWWGKETKLSGSRGSAVPAKTSSSITRRSSHRPLRSHLLDSVVGDSADDTTSSNTRGTS